MSPSEKIVLLKLADHAHPDGTHVYPSVSYISGKTGISGRQVQRYLKSFVERGILVITGHEHGGRNSPREYKFTFQFAPKKGDTQGQKGDAHDTVSMEERVTPSAQKGDTQGQKGDTQGQKGDIAVSPEPIEPIEPSGEPLDRVREKSSGKKTKPKPTPVPDAFEITDRLRAWAQVQGYTVEQMGSQVDFFLSNHRMKGNQFVDWESAFQTWMHRAKQYGHLDKPTGQSRASPNGNGKGSGRNDGYTSAELLSMGRKDTR